jgi:hypothetical protein
MGNSSCTLVVSTEKNVYCCGDTVNGRVYLSVNDRNITANTLNIHFSGIERGIVHYTEERERNGNYFPEDYYEKNQIEMMNFDVPINTPLGSIFQRGQYEFPFQFVVPQNLPSSMFCRQGQSKCEIRYDMRAYLSTNDRSTFANAFGSNTISSKPLTVSIFGSNNNMSPHLDQPINFPGHSHAVRNCFCCRRGSMELRASIDSGLFVPSQNRNLSFNLKNTSVVAVERVTVELIERVSWKPGMREEDHDFTLLKHDIDGCTHEDWMNTEQKIERAVQEFVSLSPSSRLRNASQDVNLRIPNNARDTFSGRMIQVEHFVRVKVVTRGCCVSNPETTVDINVMRPSEMFSSNSDSPPPMPSAPFMDEQEPIAEATALPANWSPLTSDVYTVPIANVISVSPGGDSEKYQTASSVPMVSAARMSK